MPTLRGHHADSSDLLADLSLMDGDESLMPASPTAGGPPPSTLFATSSNRADATAGSSRSHLPPPTFLRGASRLTDPDDGQAPLPEIPNKPKPRFSLFAPLRPAGDAARSRSSRPAPAREDPAVREAEVEDDEDGEVEADQTIGPGQMRRGSGEDGAGSDDEEAEDGEEGNGEEDYTIHARPKMTAEERDDNLRQSLYELRNMNEVFDGFLDALESARGHNEVRISPIDGQKASARAAVPYTAQLSRCCCVFWRLAVLTYRRGSRSESNRPKACWITIHHSSARRIIPEIYCLTRAGPACKM